MGKRKAKRKQPAPKANRFGKLDSTFSCPVCHHEKSIECKMDRTHNIGSLSCRVCGVEYQTSVTYLSQPVDVYSDWIDDFEKASHAQEQ